MHYRITLGFLSLKLFFLYSSSADIWIPVLNEWYFYKVDYIADRVCTAEKSIWHWIFQQWEVRKYFWEKCCLILYPSAPCFPTLCFLIYFMCLSCQIHGVFCLVQVFFLFLDLFGFGVFNLFCKEVRLLCDMIDFTRIWRNHPWPS